MAIPERGEEYPHKDQAFKLMDELKADNDADMSYGPESAKLSFECVKNWLENVYDDWEHETEKKVHRELDQREAERP